MENEGLTFISFFNGISTGRLACTKMGIPIRQYFSIENDPYANAISRTHWNNTELGDVTKINFNEIPKIDFAFCSAPCQDLSCSGKLKGFEKGTRSSLFFYFIEFLNNQQKRFGVKPKFLVEQVKMKKEHLEVMENALGVKGVLINSSFFSAQNRQRMYFTNFPIDQSYKDKGIVLKDILEENTNNVKGGALRGRYNKDGSTSQKLEIRKDDKSNAITTVKKDSLCVQVGEADLKGFDSIKRVYSPEGKAPCLTTMQGGHREPKVATSNNSWRVLTPIECERLQTLPDNYTSEGIFFMDIKEENAPDNYYYSDKMLAWIERHGKRKNKSLRIQGDREKVQMIEASHYKGCSSQRFFGIPDKKGLRYITVLECERAQTVPDNYTAHGAEVDGTYKKISNSRRYKALGNGWTTEVIIHCLKGANLK